MNENLFNAVFFTSIDMILSAWRWNNGRQECAHEHDWPVERECEGCFYYYNIYNIIFFNLLD